LNRSLIVGDDEGDERVDVFLSQRVPQLSRARIQKLIASHNVTINDKPVKANHKTRVGDEVIVDWKDGEFTFSTKGAEHSEAVGANA